MHVPILSIVFIVFDILLGILIPLGMLIYMRRKFRVGLRPYFTGYLVMCLFALILEQMFHAAVLSTPLGDVILGSTVFTALYGGMAAGLFEEGGRFLAMRFLMRDCHFDDHNALMYGAGHGGFETLYVLVFGMLNDLIYAVMINSGQAETLLAPLGETERASLQAVFDTLTGSSPFLFLVSPVERIAALAAQMALSVLVWFAATRIRRRILIPAAMVLHMFIDAAASWSNSCGLPVIVTEIIVCVIAAVYVFLAKKLWDTRLTEPTDY